MLSDTHREGFHVQHRRGSSLFPLVCLYLHQRNKKLFLSRNEQPAPAQKKAAPEDHSVVNIAPSLSTSLKLNQTHNIPAYSTHICREDRSAFESHECG